MSLNVVALISGGKDSMFSLLHCQANGHKVIALANLYPASEEPIEPDEVDGSDTFDLKTKQHAPANPQWDSDVDSYMYQTAGHHLIPLYAKALDLPLYRQEIHGSARDASLSYSGHEQDETEALVPLLRKVKDQHPEANAVSSGAILSTYQRTRIEAIAVRLGFVPLSYLWQYPSLPPPSPGSLLEDMAKAGFDIRIIKVASGGLDKSLLWSNLMDPLVRRKVERAVGRFGGSVLGEGGEYETMVVKGPAVGRRQLGCWRGSIEISEADRRVITEHGSDTASVAFKGGSGRVTSSEGCMDHSDLPAACPRKPSLWDANFHKLLLKKLQDPSPFQVDDALTESRSDPPGHGIDEEQMTFQLGNTYAISNLTACKGSSASEQMSGISQILLALLGHIKRPTSSIVFTTIILRSMTDFAAVNSVYGQLFKKPNPPARVTIACALPRGTKIILSVLVNMGEKVDALHVQSRSYWAPANIGPYSQAVRIPLSNDVEPSWVFVAGQIPLIPSLMDTHYGGVAPKAAVEPGALIPLAGFQERALLSLQHLWRIGVERRVGWWAGTVAFIAGGGGSHTMQKRAAFAWQTWKEIHDPEVWEEPAAGEDGYDVWDQRYGAFGRLAIDDKDDKPLPDFTSMTHEEDLHAYSPAVPGFFAVQVDELPRHCDIEWQSLGIAYSEVKLAMQSIHDLDDNCSVSSVSNVRSCTIPSLRRVVAYVEVHLSPAKQQELTERRLSMSIDWARNAAAPNKNMLVTIYTTDTSLALGKEAQIVPCTAIWGPKGDRLAAGIVIHFDMKD